MLKQDGSVTTSSKVALGLKCGECIHFKRGPAAFEKLCSQMGIESFSKACPEYTPDMTKLVSVDENIIGSLGEIAKHLNGPQLRILTYVFRNMDFVKKAGLEFGQPVVFSISGQEILSNYVRGYVIGADKTGEVVYISSTLEKLNGKNNAFIALLRPAILTVNEYRIKRGQLVKEGRIAEPEPVAGSNKRTILQCLKMGPEAYEFYRSALENTPDTYKPPALDVVPADWIDHRSVAKIIDSDKAKEVTKKPGKKVNKNGNQLPNSIRVKKQIVVNTGNNGKKSGDGKVFEIKRYDNKSRPQR